MRLLPPARPRALGGSATRGLVAALSAASLVAAGLLPGAGSASAYPAAGSAAGPDAAPVHRLAATGPGRPAEPGDPGDAGTPRGRPQTSDRVPGRLAPARLAPRSAVPLVTGEVEREVAPGVVYRRWTQQDDPARNPYRVHLLDVDTSLDGVDLDLVAGVRTVRQRRTVAGFVRDEAYGVAGVNGDFFDIGDTQAPLGNSRDRQRGMLGGRRHDWTRTFWIDGAGVARIGVRRLEATIVQRPRWEVAHLNSPTVWPGRIGVYTSRWGSTLGARVTDGRTRHVREVVVRKGRVVANRTRLSRGLEITGPVLIGRGEGADRLRGLRIGERVTVRRGLSAPAEVAIGGSHLLLRGGAVKVTDDAVRHPRTAVGVDRDTGHVLLVVVDGRSETSAGATLVELADLLAQVGAEDALNLDGGGSSTMVGRNPLGSLVVLNEPSDGSSRPVPNGLVVHAR